MKTEIHQQVLAPADLARLRGLLGQLVGKVCWGARLGYGDELTLDIGGRVVRLPKEVPPREKGEWVLGARATPWWIDPGPSAAEQNDTEALVRRMEGATIAGVEIGYPDLSLALSFDNGCTLSLVPEPDDAEDAAALAYWQLFGPRRAVLEVGPGPVWTFCQDE